MSDEFDDIRTLFAPLSAGAPGAFGLTDDAAVISSRPGFDLVVTKDALVCGVHFLPDDPPDQVARKLLRVNLSDLAAKGAEPYGYLLSVHWPADFGPESRSAFAAGLAHDQAEFGLHLLGGDTVSTPGPLTVTATMIGWTPAGAMVRRSGARAGDLLAVTGTIGDGGLGLKARLGRLSGLPDDFAQAVAARYRLPQPRVGLASALRAAASAAADVSDGLLADAGHIGEASGLAVEIDLDRVPLSPAASAWLSAQPDAVPALLELATSGDDYEIVCAVPEERLAGLVQAAEGAGAPLAVIGRLGPGRGLTARRLGSVVPVARAGWRHH